MIMKAVDGSESGGIRFVVSRWLVDTFALHNCVTDVMILREARWRGKAQRKQSPARPWFENPHRWL